MRIINNRYQISNLIERFFIISGLVTFTAILSAGLYFNKIDENLKIKNNLQKIHSILSQFIAPSLAISDLSEVKRLLYMSSGLDETYLVVDNDGMIIMSDYSKKQFYSFVSEDKDTIKSCNIGFSYVNTNDGSYIYNCTVLKNTDLLFSGKKIGVLISFTRNKWNLFSSPILYFIGLFIFCFFISIYFFRKMLYQRLLLPLIALKDRMLCISNDFDHSSANITLPDGTPNEILEIKKIFEKLLNNLQDDYSKRIEIEKMKTSIELAAGVAHDIRSPLMALDLIIKDIKDLPEDRRLILRNSANRINDIANNLLTQFRSKDSIGHIDEVVGHPELLCDLLFKLVSEKRVQYANDGIKFTLQLSENVHGKFVFVGPSTFHRIMSNLIDNACQAAASKITLIVNEANGLLRMQIIDNGRGIEDFNLRKILDGCSISTKEKGNGIGLSNAIKTVRNEWNGYLDIHSIVNLGTTVEMWIPQTDSPGWFLDKLTIRPNTHLVILDDDESIHQVWISRFNEINANVKFSHYYTIQNLSNWRKNCDVNDIVFLVDYELLGHAQNGLDAIEELNIANNSILVTSRNDDLTIRERCEKMKVRIIPKNFAAFIPIALANDYISDADCIFLDDNPDITNAWAICAKSSGRRVATYNSIQSFKVSISQYSPNIPIYVDHDLNDEVSGKDFAKELYDVHGFRNIYLATGYQAVDFPKMYWIKEVVGKGLPSWSN